MQQQISIITLGVSDLEGMTAWYEEKFGWKRIPMDNKIVFRLPNMVLILVKEKELAKDLCVWEDGYGFKRFMLTIGFNSEKELDKTFDELRKKGVSIIRELERIPGNIYRARVIDPEENCWELAFYPFTEIDLCYGRAVLPETIYQ